jgi:hypothetical protein
MVKCVETIPSYATDLVSVLASNDDTWGPRQRPLEDCIGCGIDEEDMRQFFVNFARHVADKDCGFIHCRPTEKPPGTCSDYYHARVSGCPEAIFVKFFVLNGVLIVSSFKDYQDE